MAVLQDVKIATIVIIFIIFRNLCKTWSFLRWAVICFVQYWLREYNAQLDDFLPLI